MADASVPAAAPVGAAGVTEPAVAATAPAAASTMQPPAPTATTPTPTPTPTPRKPTPPLSYYAMVVDSGPIIKQDVRNLMGKADTYVTTPSVLKEIRDSRAREYLEHSVLPLLDLTVREPSDKAVQDVIAFAKQTGDYASLSTVDLQVLALTLDLEREGCAIVGNNVSPDHIRTTPKRKIGLGQILPMNSNSNTTAQKNNSTSKPTTDAALAVVAEEKKGEDGDGDNAADADATATEPPRLLGREDYDEVEDSDESDDDEEEADQGSDDDSDDEDDDDNDGAAPPSEAPAGPVRKTWATLVNPAVASSAALVLPDPAAGLSLASVTIGSSNVSNNEGGGQFDDASEDDDSEGEPNIDDELQMDFPSLAASITVPFEGEDDEIQARLDGEAGDGNDNDGDDDNDKAETTTTTAPKAKVSVFRSEEEMQKNLQPLSKSGRTYNSFRKYKGLMKPKPVKKKVAPVAEDEEEQDKPEPSPAQQQQQQQAPQSSSSRFLSGGGGGETMRAEDDDGLGWITSASDIQVLKTEGGGRLDPGKTGGANPNGNGNNNNPNQNKASGPPVSHRTACATTDFAMQNVLLQMNLILLSTDGMRIRRLKSWVIRCGACFKIHGADEDFRDETNHYMKRLFCSHCGSGDMMQRISASVDGKTGRLKLHFSRRKQGRHHSIRGTKFSLPKAGSGNKYKGDLLLREDQLLSGAWNQKVRINSGRKYQQSRSQSMFGKDIATSVGCNVRSTSSATFGGKGWSNSTNTGVAGGGGFGQSGSSSDDIRVGFGARKNPNAAKGRERRGKKKKSSDRACGMRRY